MQTVAQSWLVLTLTGSAFYLGVDTFLATLPMILFSLIGGVLADRFDRRHLLLGSQVAQMATAFTLALLLFTDRVEIWMIFLLSFLTGTAQSFGGPAYQALLPALVKREEISKAIALNSTQFNLARMIGPVLAGLAFTSLGAAACFLLNGLSFLPVIVTLLMISAGGFLPEQRKVQRSLVADMKEGLRFVSDDHAIKQLTFLAFTATFFGVPVGTLLPVVARNIYSMTARGYSWMLATYAFGSLAGALFYAGSVEARRGRTALVSQIAFAISLTVFAVSPWLPLTLIALFVCGASLIGVITTISSLVQLASSEQMRGRVMSIFMLAFRGGMPLGSLFSGFLADSIGVRHALLINAAGLATVGVSFLASRSRVKKL